MYKRNLRSKVPPGRPNNPQMRRRHLIMRRVRPDIGLLITQPRVSIGTCVACRQVALDFGLRAGIHFLVQIRSQQLP
jgi:hypothetical protein